MDKGNVLLYSITKIFILLVLALLLSCTEETVSPEITQQKETSIYEDLVFSDKIELFNFPTFGSINTNFNFDVILKDSSLKVSTIKYDFTYDHDYDTSVTTFDTISTQFKLFGYNTIIASVELEDQSVLSCSTIVWLTEPKIISSNNNVYYEPNIYNGQMISVTHGVGHTAQLIDIISLKMDCYFCGYSSDSFIEMHTSIPSFDGNKLLFDNGTNYDFCYYDFEKNDSTITDIPIKLSSYPIGQITWSLNSESIYYVSVDDSYQTNGIKQYNLESNQITNLYGNGNYICVIPDQNEKLAILEKTNDSHSKLIIYNTESKTIDKEYNNIPFYAPFRMLRDSDRIYFDGELAFFSLSRKKIFHMHFEELDLLRHMYGEADINMDGNKFIIGTWNDNRALYSIALPNYF